jgi:S1-C subfamily serine protease
VSDIDDESTWGHPAVASSRATPRRLACRYSGRAVTYDETWDDGPTRRLPLAAIAIGVALAALASSMLVLVRQSRVLGSERSARQAEIGRLQKQVTLLQSRGSALAGRLGSAEKTLKRRDTGIAPLAARVLKSVFTVETDRGLGSGFIAWRDSDSSYLLTANHVVEGQLTGDITVSRKGGSWSGEIDAVDPKHDLAVIRISARPVGAWPLWQTPRTGLPQTGDQLLLLGSPYGLYGTVTTGIVSRVTGRVIQTDAAANPGNSGGPALDKEGNVVGVLVAGGGENINFVVPIRLACAKLRRC